MVMEKQRVLGFFNDFLHPADVLLDFPGNVLNDAFAFQVGIVRQLCNVVSLVVLPNGEENQLGPLTRSAMQVGLSVFSSTAILSRDKSLLGTFQLYCCDQRRPTRQEFQLIGRAVQLAAIALQRNTDKENFEKPRNEMSDSPPLKQFIN